MTTPLNPRVFGKFEIIRRIAAGGMGEIFLARQTGMAGFDRLAILKSLLPALAKDPDMLAQFFDEARITGSINHPNVVACFEVGEWEGVYFIAMEYVGGVDVATLQEAAEKQGLRFPVNVALSIAREAALGLDSAHHAQDAMGRALKIVHRDTSPHNIMVRQDGLAKIVDFGVALATNRQKQTNGQVMKGKIGYMPPEQIKGQRVDARGDQFSLGVTLWELLCGKRLFTADDAATVFMRIIDGPPPAPSSVVADVGPEIDAIVLRMTAQDPAQRYPRLADAAAALRRVLDARGARDAEASELVEEAVGAQLRERVRDLSPSPVRIIGMTTSRTATPVTADQPAPCKACRQELVAGDKFCRNCGTPIVLQAPAQASVSTRRSSGRVPRFNDEDLLDVQLDDGSRPTEQGVCCASIELADGVTVGPATDAVTRPLHDALEALARRFGGDLSRTGARLVATFHGDGRGTRAAMAFARRAALMTMKARPGLSLRAGVSGQIGVAHMDASAGDDAERALKSAASASILVTARARELAAVAQWYGPPVPLQGGDSGAQRAHEIALPPRLAGRADVQTLIDNAVAAADKAAGQQHLLLGDGGTGKSQLLDVVDGEARDRGFIVARARCARSRARPTYGVLRDVIRSACLELLAIQGDEGEWHAALPVLGLATEDQRRIRALLDDTLTPRDDDLFASAAVPLARRRLVLRGALMAFFSAAIERRGLCVLLDDVQRSDVASLEFLAEVAARSANARFILFATGRPVQGERALPLARRCVLGPLGEADLGEVAGLAAGGALPPEAARLVAQAAAGSPLVAALAARYLVTVRLLHVDGLSVTASGDLARFPLPRDLGVLVFATHALLSDAGREALAAAAQLGQIFSVRDVATLLDQPTAVVQQELESCVARGALLQEADGFSFPSLSELEAVWHRAAASDASLLHRRLSVALTATADVAEPGFLEAMERTVHHRMRAVDLEDAAIAAQEAGDGWARFGVVEAAAEHHKRALSMWWKLLSALPGDTIAEGRASSAFLLAARASLVAAEAAPQSAVDLAMPLLRLLPSDIALTARCEALRARASLLVRLRRHDDAYNLLDDTLGAFADQLDDGTRASLLVELAAASEARGDLAGAKVHLAQALKTFAQIPYEERHAGVEERAGEALLALGRLHLRTRDFDAATEILTLALKEGQRTRGAALAIDALCALASVELAHGRLERCLKLLDDATIAARGSGDGVALARIRQQAARALQQQNRLQDALAAAQDAQRLARAIAWDEGATMAGQLVNGLAARVTQ